MRPTLFLMQVVQFEIRPHGGLLQQLGDFSYIAALKSVLVWASIHADLPCYVHSLKIVHVFCTTAQTRHGYEKRQY